MDELDPELKDATPDVRELDPRKAAAKLVKDFRKSLVMLSEGSSVELESLKRLSVADYVEKIEHFCSKLKPREKDGSRKNTT